MLVLVTVLLLLTPVIAVSANDHPAEGSIVGEDERQTEDMYTNCSFDVEEIEMQDVNEELVGDNTKTVGNGVTASFESNTGAVSLYSNGGTLWKDWIDSQTMFDRESIKSIKVVSGTVYLPADSRGHYYQNNKEYISLF